MFFADVEVTETWDQPGMNSPDEDHLHSGLSQPDSEHETTVLMKKEGYTVSFVPLWGRFPLYR